MSEPFFDRWRRQAADFFLALDARFDSGIYNLGVRVEDGWERFSVFMDRFQVSGFRRIAAELASESFSLGALGMVAMLSLAVPAFRETSDDWLKKSELAVTFLDRYGNEIGRRGIRHNNSVPLEEFPDHLVKAVLATEDRRFYEHFGIDILGTLRAVVANARAEGVVQGGSSLTQQLAKNLFLSNERTIERKIKEAFLALWLEANLSKKEILRLYLDRAYMGGGTFGAAAAAQFYFGKSVRDVTLAEAAMLAGLFKAPSKFAPHANLPAARQRANTVLDNLVEAGFMTEGQVFGARKNPATPVDRKDADAPQYYLDWAFDEVRKWADTLPASVNERVFVVKTGLDRDIQREAEKAIEDNLKQFGRDYNARQGAMVIMDPSGLVRAMVGGRDYGSSQFNRATDATRQPGSSFKPFVYATAFMNGFTPRTAIRDEPICLGNWCPQNYGRNFSGQINLSVALIKSINTVPVRLSVLLGKNDAKAGRAKIVQLARELGLSTPLPDSSSLPIGSAEVTVLDMTTAYAAFANGGRRVKSHAIIEVRTPSGEILYNFDRDVKPGPQVVTPRAIADLNVTLTKVVEEGTGKRAIIEGIKVAGKTGTTNGYRDGWFVGFTGNYVAAVWFGNDDYQPTRKMTGGSLPAMAFRQAMAFAHQGIELKPIPGVAPDATTTPVAANRTPDTPAPQRPATLSRRSHDVLITIERLLREADPQANLLAPRAPVRNAGLVLSPAE